MLTAVGNFEAIHGIDVTPESTGKVTKINFRSGQFVNKDDLLLDLDDQVEQATLKFNQSDLTLQEINYQRQLDLQKKGATPGSSVDEALAKKIQAQANVDRIIAEINRKHTKAPFTGRLGIRQVNLGEYVTPGQSKIVTLQSLDPLYLKFYLPEQYLSKLIPNQKIYFSLEQYPDFLFTGIITAINSKIDSNTHNVLIQAQVPNCPFADLKNPKNSTLLKTIYNEQENKLVITCDSDLNSKNKINFYSFIPGMFANISVLEPVFKEVIVVPATAISYSLYGNSVFYIKPDNTVTRKFVKTGEMAGNEIVILSGIKEGDNIVAAGELKLQEGTTVTINNDVTLNSKPDNKQLSE